MMCFFKTTLVLEIKIVPCISDLKGSVEIVCNKNIKIIEWFDLETQSNVDALFSRDNMKAADIKHGSYSITYAWKHKVHTLFVNVPKIELPFIQGYTVQHATSDYARDGKIEANVTYMPSYCSFLWTTGVVTQKPILEDVQPGIYTVRPIDASAQSVAHIHNCSVAEVKVQRRNFT